MHYIPHNLLPEEKDSGIFLLKDILKDFSAQGCNKFYINSYDFDLHEVGFAN